MGRVSDMSLPAVQSVADLTPADLTPVDLTLPEIRTLLGPRIADNVPFDGWTVESLDAAADAAGVDRAVARLAFGDSPMAMIGAWIDAIDGAMEQALPTEMLAGLSIRERIRRLVQFRLDAVAGREEAVRRALAVFAMPGHVAAALRRGWHSVDVMWRLAGDRSADYNYYTKRTTLAAVYTATLAAFIDDTSEGKADTAAFLDRRIDGIIRFEKAKARLVPPAGKHFSVARFLGRLRYPAR